MTGIAHVFKFCGGNPPYSGRSCADYPRALLRYPRVAGPAAGPGFSPHVQNGSVVPVHRFRVHLQGPQQDHDERGVPSPQHLQPRGRRERPGVLFLSPHPRRCQTVLVQGPRRTRWHWDQFAGYVQSACAATIACAPTSLPKGGTCKAQPSLGDINTHPRADPWWMRGWGVNPSPPMWIPIIGLKFLPFSTLSCPRRRSFLMCVGGLISWVSECLTPPPPGSHPPLPAGPALCELCPGHSFEANFLCT